MKNIGTAAIIAAGLAAGGTGDPLERAPDELVQRDDIPAVIELGISAKSVSETDRTARFIASSEAIDSYGEVVKQNWDLGRYNKNPVVLYNHLRTGNELPIGTADVEMVGGKLECVIRFASAAANPMAEQVWNLVKEKVLRAVSVGFRPKTVRMETRNDEDIWILDDNELYEISVTPIGANPEALNKAKSLALAARGMTRNDTTPAVPAEKDDSMDPKELQSRIDAAEARAKSAESLVLSRDTEIERERDRSKAAETQVTELKAKLATTETKLVELDGAVDAVTKSLLEGGIKIDPSAHGGSVVKALSSAVGDIVKANGELRTKTIENEVDALVGVSISLGEKEEFVELRSTNPALFTKMIAKRAANGVLAGGPEDRTVKRAAGTPAPKRTVIPTDPSPETELHAGEGDDGEALANIFEKGFGDDDDLGILDAS